MGQELPANFVVRGRAIYIRIEVPEDVRAAFGRKAVFQSLGTGNRKIAFAKGYKRLSELHLEWDEIRRRAALTPAHRHHAAHSFYQAELERDEQRRAMRPTAEDIETARAKARQLPPELQSYIASASKNHADFAILIHSLDFAVMRDADKMDRKARATFMTELRSHLGSGETALVESFADDIVRREGLDAPRGYVAHRRLCQDLLRSWIAALETMNARDEGNYAFAPSDPIVSPTPGGPAPLVAKPGESIMEMFDLYAEDNSRNVKADTLRYSRPIVELFAQTLPARYPASGINKKVVVAWHDLLRRFPRKATETSAFRGLKTREIVAANQRLPVPKPAISPQTRNKYMHALGAFCTWLSKRDVIETNPTHGLTDTLDKDRKPVRSYTPDELSRIFRSPLFVGFEVDGKEHLPGDRHADDWRCWLPLLALYSGARLGELAQLLTADVRQESGHWIFDLTTEGDTSKSLKNRASRRVVPVHPELVKLGFLSFHTRKRQQGHARLFPEIRLNTRGQVSGDPSRWYARFLVRIGVKIDRSINFHSFRHGMADAYKRAGYLDHQFAFMLGHSDIKTTITRGYGSIGEGTLALRVEMIGKVEFPGLDLSHFHQNRGVPAADRISAPG